MTMYSSPERSFVQRLAHALSLPVWVLSQTPQMTWIIWRGLSER